MKLVSPNLSMTMIVSNQIWSVRVAMTKRNWKNEKSTMMRIVRSLSIYPKRVHFMSTIIVPPKICKSPFHKKNLLLHYTTCRRWSHDRFDKSEQAPKSRTELVLSYGYDITK
jgi:hypothetical protein